MVLCRIQQHLFQADVVKNDKDTGPQLNNNLISTFVGIHPWSETG